MFNNRLGVWLAWLNGVRDRRLGVECVTINSLTRSVVIVGSSDSSSAAAPATCGVAIDVPLRVSVALSSSSLAAKTLTPGPRMSTHGPKFDHWASVSVMLVAPTVIARGAFAGDVVHASAGMMELPAATTKTKP